MVGSIQSSSNIPIPQYQENTTANNIGIVNSNGSVTRDNTIVAQQNQNTQNSNFEDYLNQQAILVLEQNTNSSNVFDPASEISSISVYTGSGESSPI